MKKIEFYERCNKSTTKRMEELIGEIVENEY